MFYLHGCVVHAKPVIMMGGAMIDKYSRTLLLHFNNLHYPVIYNIFQVFSISLNS
jgi:hypothetical protein